MLDRKSPKPLWEQLDEIIRANIASHKWEPGDAIPSENELCRVYGMSRMTARLTITRLVQEGYLYRVPGKGTFVAEQKFTATPLAFAGIREQLGKKGIQTTTEIIKNSIEVPPAKIISKLNLEENEKVYVIERVRRLNGKFFSFHRSYLRCCGDQVIPEERLKNDQLCNILDNDYQVVPDRIVETLEMVGVKERYLEMFDMRLGEPLLHLQDTNYMNGEIVELSEVFFKGDKIKITFDFDRKTNTLNEGLKE